MIADVRDDEAAFIAKWRGRWPEWELAQVFVPEAQRPLAEAWFALLQELTDAAWGGDPTPGLAKLAWWQEELGGWAKGARRHPLGARLQALPAPWAGLGRALPDLRALRGVEPGVPVPAAAGDAFAAAVDACEAALFGGTPAEAGRRLVLGTLLGERALLRAASMDAIEAIDPPRADGRAGTRVRGVQAALVRARLGRPAGTAVPPLRALFAAWRGARAAG